MGYDENSILTIIPKYFYSCYAIQYHVYSKQYFLDIVYFLSYFQ